MNKTKVYTFDSKEKMDTFAKENETENCFGLYFQKIDKNNFDYEVVAAFNKWDAADTTKDLWAPLISKPNLDDYEKYEENIWLYPYITDFLAKYQTGYDFTQKDEWAQRPMFYQDIGYTPMAT